MPNSIRDQKLAELLAQLTDSAQRGETVDLEFECRRHPELGAELRQLWGAVMVARAAGSDSQAAALDPNLTDDANRVDGSSSLFELPCRFGGYQLLREIGRGGMGVVYQAHDVKLQREVALKMVLRGQMASQADLDRFRAEAEAAGRLDHPGIVPVYQVDERDGQPYFTMKFIRGKTLGQRLADGPMPAREAAEILAAVSHAIHSAHEAGVLHRDIKPSNILLDEQGQPHVTDFGLAKRVTDAVSLTRSGAVLGTPTYMAPEQAAGARGQMGPASDVYSLGCVLYHMLTGRPPFQAASPVDTVLLVLEQEPVPPRVLNPKANRDLSMIALRCLQKPPDLRYESAAALGHDLEAFLNDETISARSGRLFQVLVRWLGETHHATILENWGLLWMWHSLALFTACALTNVLFLMHVNGRMYYFGLWTAGLGTWAAVFWALRRRMGPVLFVERQIAHIWAAAMIGIALLFPLENQLGLSVLKLSPVVGVISGIVFLVKAGILSGTFYIQALALFATAMIMARWPDYAHFIFGVVSAGCFFFPGLKYYRQRRSNPDVV